jgi:hypothetical protein
MGVKIKVALKTGKRIWDSQHYCYFCNEKTKLPKYFIDCHAKETDVVAMKNCEIGSSQRRLLIERLTRLGAYYYSLEVLNNHRGSLTLMRRPSETDAPFLTYRDFGPCPGCLGFLRQKDLWRHAKVCGHFRPHESTTSSNKLERVDIRTDIDLLLSPVLSSSTEASFYRQIIRTMMNDSIAQVAQQDRLIRHFGLYLYEKHCDSRRELIRQSMQILGRLLIHPRQQDECTTASLEDYITPRKFDSVVQGVKSLCCMKTDKYRNHSLASPSLTLKVGHHLKKSSQLMRGLALRERNEECIKDTEAFIDLYDVEWSGKISTLAL